MLVYDICALNKTYTDGQRPANKDIHLQIHQGEIFGLLGENGAGKTTLIRQMVNLLRSTSGTISLFGQQIGRDPSHVPQHVGYMPQEAQALNMLTVEESLYFAAHLRGMNRAEAKVEREQLLDLWQIADLRRQNSAQLSGGQRRLLRLAVAMAGKLPVLILDEPTNDLDPLRRRMVWDVLRTVSRERGTTIVFVTHDAAEAEKVIERVGIMRDGEMVAVGKPSDLKRRVDQQLRLELFYPPGQAPDLPTSLVQTDIQPGRCILYLYREQAVEILNHIDMTQIDDFKLYSATLEDLYVHYATR